LPHLNTRMPTGNDTTQRTEIEKPDGGKRPLGIPAVIDRVIQQTIAQVLTPIVDPLFSENSFGFRPDRSGQQAVQQVQQIIKQKRRIAMDMDLSRFFDRVNHDLLMSLLGRRVQDKRLKRLIARYLRAGVIDNQRYQETREGVPQGDPLSPCWLTSCSTLWIKNWKSAVTRSRGTPTTSSSW
jgi:RNA-directed DNA polymerase